LRRVQTLQYTTIDGQLSIAPRESRFKYTLYGKNLTNKAYIVGATLSSEADGVNFAQPREVGLRLNYSW
jgi:iron complex outermembrane receptor protein